jgi:hypothetical protein
MFAPENSSYVFVFSEIICDIDLAPRRRTRNILLKLLLLSSWAEQHTFALFALLSLPFMCPIRLKDDVTTTSLPRYAMPNISSMLPGYGGVEQEAIARAFTMANYDAISRLPTNLQYSEVRAWKLSAQQVWVKLNM